MIFGKSITFDEEDIKDVAAAAGVSTAFPNAEAEFIEKLRAGDAAAFDVLITRYAGDVFALLYRLTEDPAEADDLVQETFLSALKGIKGFRGDAELKTWLFRIAVNHSRNRFRWWKRRGRAVTVSLDATIGASETRIEETVESTGPNPEQAAIGRERQAALRHALVRLPETYREAVILCDIEGLSYDEIAQVLEIGLGTVKSRIARGREELRRMLKDI